jgi:hypothetical protein
LLILRVSGFTQISYLFNLRQIRAYASIKFTTRLLPVFAITDGEEATIAFGVPNEEEEIPCISDNCAGADNERL